MADRGVERRGLGDVGSQVADRPAEQHLERGVDLGGAHQIRHAAPDAADQLGEVRHRVVADLGHRGVAGLADRHHPHRAGALLADRERQRDPAVGQRQPLPGALVDRHRGPDVGPVPEQPAHADVGDPVLLVGDRDEPQVAARPEARPGRGVPWRPPGRRPRSSCRSRPGRRGSRRRRRPPRTAGASSPGPRPAPRRCGRRTPATARPGRCRGSSPRCWRGRARGPPARPRRRRR